MSEQGDFTRQGFLGPDSARTLADTRVVIAGLGGGGSHIAQQLAHVGVGHFRLVDPDVIEASNLNRLVGGTQVDVDQALEKVRILERTIKAIRPGADVEVAVSIWQEADDLLRDAHVAFGCVDGYRQRQNLERAARRFGLPYIDIGMDVAATGQDEFAVAGQMIMTLAHGPCMRCLGFLTDNRLNQEENRYGDAGINPQVVWTNGTLASLAVGAFVQLMTPWHKLERDYEWLELDGNEQTVLRSRQPQYHLHGPCIHFQGGDGLGDPFFKLSPAKINPLTEG